jgi:hypothetical protein
MKDPPDSAAGISAMKHAFTGQHFHTITDLLLGVQGFRATLSVHFVRPFVRNGYGYCSYAVEAAENTLSESFNMGF